MEFHGALFIVFAPSCLHPLLCWSILAMASVVARGPAAASPALSGEGDVFLLQLRAKKFNELKRMCMSHSLPSTGVKSDLVARLWMKFAFQDGVPEPRAKIARSDSEVTLPMASSSNIEATLAPIASSGRGETTAGNIEATPAPIAGRVTLSGDIEATPAPVTPVPTCPAPDTSEFFTPKSRMTATPSP